MAISSAIIAGVGTLASVGLGYANYSAQSKARDKQDALMKEQKAAQQKLLEDARAKETSDMNAAIFAAQQAGSSKRTKSRGIDSPTLPSVLQPLGGQSGAAGGAYKTLLGQ